MTTDSRSPAGRPAEPPPEIEGYRILKKLGHGGTSSVWKAEQVSLNRPVVIKILSESLSRDKADIDAFQSEARIAAALKHPGIVQVYDFGLSRTGRRYYFVMEYISGYSVGDWIRRKGKIAEPEALLVVHGVADALKFAWVQSRVVHCDIKPDNIMIDADGTVKVTDLGLARPFRTSAQSRADSNDAMVTGTPNYMAPEQIRGDTSLDCRTDIYALGASLHHMVTGQLPFGDSREYYHLYDAAARQAVIDARERYNGRMKIVYAIEIGQPQVCASVSRSFLDSHDFDFVLGAIHATPEGLDYYFVDYDRMDFDQMFRSYYARHLDLIRFGNINSIAHMDYPVRKMERWLRKPASMLRYKDEVAEVVRLAAQSGVALEINTNGLRNWFGRLSPEPWVLELYRAFGGTFVTTGSDAHNTDHAAFGIREARELAESLGLKTVSYYERRQPVFD